MFGDYGHRGESNGKSRGGLFDTEVVGSPFVATISDAIG